MTHHHDHQHPHDHPHPHHHPHSHPQGTGTGTAVRELWRPHAPPGEVPILDIGGDVGALVVYLPELTATGELDVQPTGRPEDRFHTGVHERAGAWVAIFPEMDQGPYELLDDHGAVRALVTVTGGEVRELDLR
jgi:hypothetical protein